MENTKKILSKSHDFCKIILKLTEGVVNRFLDKLFASVLVGCGFFSEVENLFFDFSRPCGNNF